jgi:DNA-directed RNA polymerase specialized sigma24 family protein
MANEATARWSGSSFDPFFTNTYQRVVALVAATAGDATLAEKAAQEAYRLALLRWSGVRQMNRPDVWVTRVAMRIAIDAWRKQRTRTANAGELPRAVPTEVRRLWARWELEELIPARRATILLRHLEGSGGAEDDGGPEPSETLRTSEAARPGVHVLSGTGHGFDG